MYFPLDISMYFLIFGWVLISLTFFRCGDVQRLQWSLDQLFALPNGALLDPSKGFGHWIWHMVISISGYSNSFHHEGICMTEKLYEGICVFHGAPLHSIEMLWRCVLILKANFTLHWSNAGLDEHRFDIYGAAWYWLKVCMNTSLPGTMWETLRAGLVQPSYGLVLRLWV